MANFFISEFETVVHAGGPVPAGLLPAQAHQKFTFTTATQSSVFGKKTRFIRVVSDANCYILAGDNPTATASNALRLIANRPEYFGVKAGQKLSVYDGTS